MEIYKIFFVALIFIGNYSYSWQVKTAVGDYRDHDSLPCVGENCKDVFYGVGRPDEMTQPTYRSSRQDNEANYERDSSMNSKAANKFNSDNDIVWDDWWNIKDKDQAKGTVRLCIPRNEDYLYECKTEQSDTYACIGERDGKIRDCNILQNTQFLIYICKEISSSRLVTCGQHISVPLCFTASNRISYIQPCQNKKQYICLLQNGTLEYCDHFHNRLQNKERKYNLNENDNIIHGIRENGKYRYREILNLCLEENLLKLLPCANSPFLPPACIDAIDKNIQSCKNLERFHKLAVSICVQTSSSRIVTCETFRDTYLCYPSSKEESGFKLCNVDSRMICVSQNGSLKKCSSNSTSENIFEKRIFRLKTDDHFIKGKQVHDGRKNKSEIADIVNEKEHILSWKHKNLTHLCAVKQNKQNGEEFAYCSRDASIKACFGTESGRIDRCNALRETEIIVPVCVMNPTQVLVTCGKSKSVSLCMSHDNELVFQVCRIKERTACFRDGSLQYCSPNDTIQRSTDNSKELSFHNKMNVYAFKNLLINLATTNLQYLCTNDSNDGKLEPCSENSLTLACFGVETGSIKACDDFVKDELVMPLCIKEFIKRKIMICGMFTLTNVCFHATRNPDRIMGPFVACRNPFSHACLGNDGGIIECVRGRTFQSKVANTTKYTSREKRNAQIPNGVKKSSSILNNHMRYLSLNNISVTENANTGFLHNWKSFSNFKNLPIIEEGNDDVMIREIWYPVNHVFGKERRQVKDIASNDIDSQPNHDRKEIREDIGKSYFVLKPTKSKNDNEDSKESQDSITLCSENETSTSGTIQDLIYSRNKTWPEIELTELPTPDDNFESILTTVGDEDFSIYEVNNTTEKINVVLNETLSKSWYLCKPLSSNRFVKCDEDKGLNVVCFHVKNGKIGRCESFKRTDIILPLCIERKPPNVINACGITSNRQLCVRRRGINSFLQFCKDSNGACLSKNGTIEVCKPDTDTKSALLMKNSEGDQKFFRLHCNDCTIENKMRIVGDHPEVLPEYDTYIISE